MPQLSMHSPVGDVTLFGDDGAIVALEWGWVREQDASQELVAARDQLEAYFDGDLRGFDLPLAPAGTEYQKRVWRALCEIPYGQTRTYQQLVAVAGGAARSVGQANGRNPIAILIPCHRVVATGHLGGYSGGEGPATKRWLLNLENPGATLL